MALTDMRDGFPTKFSSIYHPDTGEQHEVQIHLTVYTLPAYPLLPSAKPLPPVTQRNLKDGWNEHDVDALLSADAQRIALNGLLKPVDFTHDRLVEAHASVVITMGNLFKRNDKRHQEAAYLLSYLLPFMALCPDPDGPPVIRSGCSRILLAAPPYFLRPDNCARMCAENAPHSAPSGRDEAQRLRLTAHHLHCFRVLLSVALVKGAAKHVHVAARSVADAANPADATTLGRRLARSEEARSSLLGSRLWRPPLGRR